jgi:hypothetical protein
MKGFIKKISIIIVSVLVTTQMTLMPLVASAQVVSNPGQIAFDLSQQLQENATNKTEGALVGALASIAVNLLNYASTLVAQSTAEWIASGGAGKHPLFNRETAEQIGESISATFTSEIIDEIVPGSAMLAQFGIDPDDPDVTGLLRNFLAAPYTNNLNQIDGTEIGKNFGSYFASVSSIATIPEEATARVLSDMANSVSANEFHGFLKLYGQTRAQANAAAGVGQLRNVLNSGFEDLIDPISEKVRYPAQLVRGEFTSNLERAQENDAATGRALVAAAGKDAIIQVGVNFATTFISTLFGGLTQRLFDGFFSDIDPVTFNPFDPDSISSGNNEGIFSSLSTFVPLETSSFSLLSQLATCPATLVRDTRGIYTCAINSSFASALARAESGDSLTVQEAIDEGYINGNWPLVGPSSSRNSDPNCHKQAFCHSNLLKLRKARIIPIGWEIAAEKSGEGGITLQEVIDNFHNCGDDGTSPSQWCKLIDPNWILTAPSSQCRTLAYGQVLAAGGADTRAEECVDIQTCIAEGDNGECLGGYGYCVREENIWRFRGDSCPAEYASCVSFENTAGERVDYRVNTVDSSSCGPDAIDCLWRAREKTQTTEGQFDWPVVADVEEFENDKHASQYAIFTTSASQECDPSEAGCSDLVVRGPFQALNRVFNESFETINQDNAQPLGWVLEGNLLENDGRSGSSAIQGPATQYGIGLRQGYDYTLSYYAKTGGASTGASIDIAFIDEFADDDEGRASNPNFLALETFADDNTVCAANSAGDGYVVTTNTALSDTYERFYCRFTAPTFDTGRSLAVATLEVSGGAIVDDIVLEQSPVPTVAYSGYIGNEEILTAKVAPDYLGCTGGESDPEECEGYARVCSPADAGCSLYAPTNGDPEVTGIIGQNDFCPAECSGYDAYRQEPTLYEPTGEFPVNFIASTADQCSADAVGCDEFTNIVTEERGYFTYLRACTEPEAGAIDETGAVFYTWEGSGTEGFQLRTWNLLPSNIPALPGAGRASGTTFAPCTSWSVESNNGVERIVCEDDPRTVLAAACNERSDIFTNPDCREFYDVDGNIFYREWSKTVTVTDQCNRYRKTTIASSTSTDAATTCESAGGYFDTSTNDCTFFGYEEESIDCSESENGCRLYTGGRSANARTVFQDIFEAGTLENWSVDGSVEYSSESLANTGSSMRLNDAIVYVAENQLNTSFAANRTYTLSFIAKGEVGESMSAGIDLNASPEDGEIEINLTNGSVELSTEWEQYTFGPFDLNEFDYPTFNEQANFVIEGSGFIDNIVLRAGQDSVALIRDSWTTPASCDLNSAGQFAPGFHLGCQEYTTQAGGDVYLRSFSRLCDEDAVGCTPYYDTFESDSPHGAVYNGYCEVLDTDPVTGDLIPSTGSTDCYLTQLATGGYDESSDRLCNILNGETSCRFDIAYPLAESNIGEGALSHIRFGLDTEVIPGDIERYLIVDQEDICSADAAGCTEVGLPTYSQDKSVVTGYEAEYIVNDPDTYSEILCRGDQLFCSEFDAGEEGLYYFKDPKGQTCEYRDDIVIDGQQFEGWFREGTSEFCYGTGICQGDPISNGAACSLDSDCKTDTGTCSESSAACTQDIDCPIIGETCAAVSEATCQITDPSYLIAGVESGIWTNGDIDYDGSVGLCAPEYDQCTEFRDVLDYDRERTPYENAEPVSYTYIDNAKLDEGGLLASRRCNGEVSNKEGCVLFEDTSQPELLYSAPATDILSRHADDILGRTPDSRVKPVDCSDPSTSTIVEIGGAEVDLCANRCVYEDALVNDVGNQVTSTNFVLTNATDPVPAEDLYEFGSSCYVDSDCSARRSRSGVEVNGRCLTEVDVFDGDDIVSELVPRLENDTNRVTKVNRDRQCSEWVACRRPVSVWDPDIGQFKEVCEDILLCDEYSQTGDTTFCKSWKVEDPAVVVTEDYYTSRDTSWYGSEFSGYTIPNQFLMHHLDQMIISPDFICLDANDQNATPGRIVACDPDAEDATENNCVDDTQVCGRHPDPQYTLGYDAGSCDIDANFGDSCTIGFCSDTGAACASNDQCANNQCVTGICYDQGGVDQACTQDSDCGNLGSTFFCANDGICKATTGEYCDGAVGDETLDGTCSGSRTCTSRSSNRQGSCANGACIVASNGSIFDVNAQYEASVCRAHPEANAPFSNEIVEEWAYIEFDENSGELGSGERRTSFAYDVRSGFEQANICAPGEACECSYKRIATSAGASSYIEASRDIDLIASEVAEELGVNSNVDLGICSGGSAEGAFCVVDALGTEYGCAPVPEDEDGQNTATSIGRCNLVTRENTVLGLKGYCLERDSGINIEGDPEKGACLTWYPVDQILGETNLFAKDRDAGYFEDTFYCSEVRLYGDIGAFPGCAGIDNSSPSVTTANNDTCSEYMACPAGYFAVGVAATDGKKYGSNNTPVPSQIEQCAATTNGGGPLWGRGRNGCSYTCVPYNSTNDDGDKCEPPSDPAWQRTETTLHNDGRIRTDVWMADFSLGSSEEQDVIDAYVELVDGYESCFAYGVDHTHLTNTSPGQFNSSNYFYRKEDLADRAGEKSGPNANLNFTADYETNPGIDRYNIYPACSALIQTASDEGEGYALTDRVLYPRSTDDSNAHIIPQLGYTQNLENYPFGASSGVNDVTIIESRDAVPHKVPFCTRGDADPEGSDELRIAAFNPVEGIVCSLSELMSNYDAWPYIGATQDGNSLAEMTRDNSIQIDPGESNAVILNRITSIFARALRVYVWDTEWDPSDIGNAGIGRYRLADTDDGNVRENLDDYQGGEFDEGLDTLAAGNPPQVWGVDYSNCEGRNCQEGPEGTITLNGQSFGDIEPNADEAFFKVNLSFFAAADKNQMPLRQILVDWNDIGNGPVGADDNFFKNRRGLDFSGEERCDGTEWGKTDESCESGYFYYSNIYTCNRAIAQDAGVPSCDDAGENEFCIENKDNGDPSDDVCRYRPRVHVRDQWGWCTGECSYNQNVPNPDFPEVTSDDDDTCFDATESLLPLSDSECDYTSIDPQIDPWVYYDGYIRVPVE